MAKEKLTGIQKAALLFITLGPEASSNILNKLPMTEIQKITYEIANISSVTSEQRQAILEEFLEMNKAKDYLVEGGIDYARELLSKALGPQRASEILNKVAEASQINRPFAIARKADAQQLLNVINYEHPQTIALILCYLQTDKAAQIISELPDEIQSEVAYRIATMNTTSPAVIKEIEKVLDDKLSSIVKTETTVLGGIDTLVGILNQVDRTTEKNITESLEAEDSELAEKEVNFFGYPIRLSLAQVKTYLRYLQSLCKNGESPLEIKLLSGRLTTDYQYEMTQCIFLSDSNSYLISKTENRKNNLALFTHPEMTSIFDRFFQDIWNIQDERCLSESAEQQRFFDHMIHNTEIQTDISFNF